MHFCFYSILPFASLAILNSFIVYRTLYKSNSIAPVEKYYSRKKRISIVILVLTIGFILTTLPSAIITGFLFEQLETSLTGKLKENKFLI